MTLLSIIFSNLRSTTVFISTDMACFAVPDSVWRLNIDVPEEASSVSLDNNEDRWWDQTELTKLILASNWLTELSDDISNLSSLTVLDVSV